MSSFKPGEIADLVDKAADYIETHGWTQEEFYGWDAAHNTDFSIEECKVCARGGLAAGAGAHPEFSECPIDTAKLSLIYDEDDHEFRLADEDQARLDLIRAAEKAFAAHLRNTASGFDKGIPDEAVIARWNDWPYRTAEQVVAEMRACAAGLRTAGPA